MWKQLRLMSNWATRLLAECRIFWHWTGCEPEPNILNLNILFRFVFGRCPNRTWRCGFRFGHMTPEPEPNWTAASLIPNDRPGRKHLIPKTNLLFATLRSIDKFWGRRVGSSRKGRPRTRGSNTCRTMNVKLSCSCVSVLPPWLLQKVPTVVLIHDHCQSYSQ